MVSIANYRRGYIACLRLEILADKVEWIIVKTAFSGHLLFTESASGLSDGMYLRPGQPQTLLNRI